jgi:transcriptional regulator with XRE-family HTH domain
MGYRANVVFDWESGRRQPSARKAFGLAKATGVDVEAALDRFLKRACVLAAPLDTKEGVAQLMETLRGQAKVTDIARQMGVSRFTVGRWLAAQGEPSLAELFHFVEVTTLRLLDFVAQLTDPGALDSVGDAYRRLTMARELAYDAPWSHAVLRTLELADYRCLSRHRVGFVAELLGISLEEERTYLEQLEDAGQVRLVDGRYEVIESGTVDTRSDPEKSRELRAFWTDVAAGRLRSGAEGEFSFNLFSVSLSDLERLKDLQRRYFAEFRRIVAESTPEETVVLTSVQLLPLTKRR